MTNLRVVAVDAVVDEDEKPSFDAFWLLYPKKVAKFDAARSWKRLSSGEQLDAMIGLVSWRQVWIREARMQFVPYAATWLNGQRWADELPDLWQQTGHASHAAAKLPADTERTSMPDHVRAALAKLRK